MKLPNYEKAFVEERKITQYLLDFESADGQHKAAFFVRFGFKISNWRLLAEALVEHGHTNDLASQRDAGEFGAHYTVEGPLVSPAGRSPNVRTVWEITPSSKAPRLITAYPLQPIQRLIRFSEKG